MKVAYFSTVETTISSSSYSLLTSSGRLLMIDISFLLVIYLLPLTRAKHVVKGTHNSVPWAGATPRFFGQPKAPKSGVAPAQLGVLPASKIDCRAMRNLYAPTNFRSPLG